MMLCPVIQMGQVMNGLIYGRAMAPRPNRNGFLVPSVAFTLFNACPCFKSTETSRDKPVIDALHSLRTVRYPFLGLYYSGETSHLHLCGDESEDDLNIDTSFSTDDSFGPYTPPQSRCGTPPCLVHPPWPSAFPPGGDDEVSLFLPAGPSAIEYLHRASSAILRVGEKQEAALLSLTKQTLLGDVYK
jgi:hypothetical protein